MATTLAKTMGIISSCFLMSLILLAGLNSNAMAADMIKIAMVDPFSGPFDYIGRIYYAGIKFAVDEQNAKGGLLGKKIEIIKGDSQAKSDVSIRNAKKLILEKKVNFIGVGLGSHIATALNKLATEYKTIMINYGAMSNIVQGKEFSRYAFRVCENSYNVTSALAQLMAIKPYRKFYIIAPDYIWGRDVAMAFKSQLKMYLPDVEIVGEDYHPLGAKEYGPYIAKVVAAKADAVFSGSFTTDLTGLVKKGRAMGLTVPFPFVAPFGWGDPVLKEDAVGIYTARGYTMQVDTRENKAMIAKYHEQHKDDEDFITQWPSPRIGHIIFGWQMVFAAVEKAGSLNPENIIEAFEGIWYKTPVGWWHMRKCDHQVILPMFGMVVKAGPNPFYDFPWFGPDIVRFPATESAIPPTSDYNPRCP